MAGALNSIAMTVKEVGQDVMNGMRGDIKSYTKQYGQRVLKSNMTAAQLGETAARSAIKQKAATQIGKNGGEAVEKAIGNIRSNLTKKGLSQVQATAKINGGGAFGSAIGDKVIGRQLAKNDLGYRVGDAIGGGLRDTMRSKKAGHNLKTALSAGFTKMEGGTMAQVGGQTVRVGGKRTLRADRVAGAAFGAAVVGRVASGGGLYRDRYGRVNVPGVPFI